ncbi:MAG: C40 family peptidase [Gammaproteobacteria bacterium]
MPFLPFPVNNHLRQAQILLIALFGLGGCAWEPEIQSPPRAARVPVSATPEVRPTAIQTVSGLSQRQKAARVASRQIGVPYRWGGASPAGFDCSGLIHFVYAQADVTLPRTAAGQQESVRTIPLRDAQPGDLLFFNLRTKNDHVGIYVGDNAFVHAPSKGKSVQRLTLDNPYFYRRLSTVGRVRIEPSSH